VSRTKAELQIAAWGALTFGALLASFMAFRPVRDALVLDGDADQIPWLFTGTFVAVTLVTPVWGAAVHRKPRRVVPIAFHVFALCALGFFAAIRAEIAPITVGRIFYMWSAVFNIFVVSVFWSLLADLLGHDTARRLYGPIAAGGTVGGVAGPALTKLLLADIGVAGVLVMTALLLELAVLGVWRLRLIGDTLEGDRAHDDALPARTPFEGLRQLRDNRYLAAIAAYVLCTATAGTFVYLAQADIVKQAIPDRAARTDFFATIDLWVNAGTLVVQLLIAAPLLRWLGPGILLCLLPVAQGVGIIALVAAPTLTALVAVQISSRITTHGITRPARELLFTVVSRDEKYRAKNAIDTFVFRLGDTGAAWLRLGLVEAHAGGLALSGAAVPLTVIWLALALGLGVGFRRRAHVKESSSS
jgi:ATP:ADP antiporter, AAA family